MNGSDQEAKLERQQPRAAVSLCRDCWHCECAIPVAWVRDETAVPCVVPIECPYCGAMEPLGHPPNDLLADDMLSQLLCDASELERQNAQRDIRRKPRLKPTMKGTHNV